MSGELLIYGNGVTYNDALRDAERLITRQTDAFNDAAGRMEYAVDTVRNDFQNSLSTLEANHSRELSAMQNNFSALYNETMNSVMNAQYGISNDIWNSTQAVIATQQKVAEIVHHDISSLGNSLNNTINTSFSLLFSGISSLDRKADAFLKSQAETIEILKHQRETQSQEDYEKAEEYFNRKLFEDALERCKKAIENNEDDYWAWYLCGHIYLFGADEDSNVIDIDKAINAYEQAVKYIKHAQNKEELQALLSEIYYFLGFARFAKSNDLLLENDAEGSKKKLIEAEDASRKSFELSDKTRLIAGYEQAKELHFLERDEEALSVLEELIRTNENFALKAGTDPNFESINDRISELIIKLRDELVDKIKPELEEYERRTEMLSGIEAWGVKHENAIADLKRMFPKPEVYETYFSIREFDEKLWKKAQQKMDEIVTILRDNNLSSLYKKAKEKHSSGNDEQALIILKELIIGCWYFVVQSRCDKDFASIWDKIDDLVKDLRDELVSEMEETIVEYDRQAKMLSDIEAWGVKNKPVLKDLKDALPDANVFEDKDYFTTREFKEKVFKEIQNKMDRLIAFCCSGENPVQELERYNKIQEFHTYGNDEQALKELEELIREEWYFAVKARCDKNFEPLWNRIDALIITLRDELAEETKNGSNETRSLWEKRIENLRQQLSGITTEIKAPQKKPFSATDFKRETIRDEKAILLSDIDTVSQRIDEALKPFESLREKDYYSVVEKNRKFKERRLQDYSSYFEWSLSELDKRIQKLKQYAG